MICSPYSISKYRSYRPTRTPSACYLLTDIPPWKRVRISRNEEREQSEWLQQQWGKIAITQTCENTVARALGGMQKMIYFLFNFCIPTVLVALAPVHQQRRSYPVFYTPVMANVC